MERMHGGQLDEEERRGTAESVNKIAAQLGRTTLAAGQLLCRVLQEGGELSIAEAAARGTTSKAQVRELVRQLDGLWLAHLQPLEYDDPGYRPERIVVRDAIQDHNDLLHGYDFFGALRHHIVTREDPSFHDVIVDMDFSLLD
ncbi:hypothetical protein [Streptomyces sp. NPDC093261]|uniref:hypothetical protein n=1 Tax=Streptomyces sp. NPDC093261 TaxID=3366037 RepID=UPI003802F4C1